MSCIAAKNQKLLFCLGTTKEELEGRQNTGTHHHSITQAPSRGLYKMQAK